MLAKLTRFFIRLFGLGAGYTWSGQVALNVYPAVLSNPSLLPRKGLIFVSGTNGKTTTTKMLVHMLRNNGVSVVTNDSGANLINGVTASLLLDTDTKGIARSDVGVFEVDEFTLPSLLTHVTPYALVLLNLSRDQLDRYGETDIILGRWAEAAKKLSSKTKLFINTNQQNFALVSTVFKGESTGFDGTSLDATIKVGLMLGMTQSSIRKALNEFKPAWGRGEVVAHKGFTWKIHLAKNPASFDTNLGNALSETLLFIFNDNIPDGRDVSWIYDISTEKLFNACKDKTIYVAGKRAFDMAVRLQYAGIAVAYSKVIPDVREVIKVIENSPQTKEATAFPNYSAMLELRKVLLGRSIL